MYVGGPPVAAMPANVMFVYGGVPPAITMEQVPLGVAQLAAVDEVDAESAVGWLTVY